MLCQEAVETLIGVGLTLCQSRVYVALCQLGATDAKTVSKFADVPRQDFYRIVLTLQDLGLVEKIISYPLTFKAIPLDLGAFLLIERRKQDTEILEKRMKDILENFRMDNNTEIHLGNSKFVLISGKDSVFKKIGKFIEKAESNIDVITSWRRFSKIHYFFDLLKEASARGVKIQLISEIPPKDKASESLMDLVNRNSLCEVKLISYFPKTILSIFDKKEVLIISDPKAELTEGDALWSNNPSLLAAMNDFYEMTWKTAQKELPNCIRA